jgi:hypothetical protein
MDRYVDRFWPNVGSELTVRIKRKRGRVAGFIMLIKPVWTGPRIPMSAREAAMIAGSMPHGALHRLHRLRRPDLVALRALEVSGAF